MSSPLLHGGVPVKWRIPMIHPRIYHVLISRRRLLHQGIIQLSLVKYLLYEFSVITQTWILSARQPLIPCFGMLLAWTAVGDFWFWFVSLADVHYIGPSPDVIDWRKTHRQQRLSLLSIQIRQALRLLELQGMRPRAIWAWGRSSILPICFKWGEFHSSIFTQKIKNLSLNG